MAILTIIMLTPSRLDRDGFGIEQNILLFYMHEIVAYLKLPKPKALSNYMSANLFLSDTSIFLIARTICHCPFCQRG